MAQLDVTAHDVNAAARKSQAKLHLGLPKLQKSVSACVSGTQSATEIGQVCSVSKPSHDLSVAKVIDLIEKRLKWIHRTDLHVGLMNCYENNHYAVELVRSDRRPVYYVHVDAHAGRFYWSEAKASRSGGAG